MEEEAANSMGGDTEKSGLTYAEAGVDIKRIGSIHRDIEGLIPATFSTRTGKVGEVLGIRGHYAGLIDIGNEKALALHADSVGTKVLIAQMLRQYDTIGIDCVAMNVNDLVCVGAEPLALVDYLALETPNEDLVRSTMIGLANGAREANIAVIGGETAIMKDVINGFDLAAMSVGIVEKSKIIRGEEIATGDLVIGLPSSGVHSNGLTLARKVLFKEGLDKQVAKELLTPTRIYSRQIHGILVKGVEVHGLAHVTGGAYSKLRRLGKLAGKGFHLDNLFKPQKVFREIQERGNISDLEMYRTFNMGTGFLIIAPEESQREILGEIRGSKVVGKVVEEKSVTVEVDSKRIEVDRW
jgi:phosphoribosylformylglycinamidine cyclo-ligase